MLWGVPGNRGRPPGGVGRAPHTRWAKWLCATGVRSATRNQRRTAGAAAQCSTLFDLGLGLCQRLLDLFQGELKLIGVEPFRTAPEPRALQFLQQMPQAIDLLDGMIAFGRTG